MVIVERLVQKDLGDTHNYWYIYYPIWEEGGAELYTHTDSKQVKKTVNKSALLLSTIIWTLHYSRSNHYTIIWTLHYSRSNHYTIIWTLHYSHKKTVNKSALLLSTIIWTLHYSQSNHYTIIWTLHYSRSNHSTIIWTLHYSRSNDIVISSGHEILGRMYYLNSHNRTRISCTLYGPYFQMCCV